MLRALRCRESGICVEDDFVQRSPREDGLAGRKRTRFAPSATPSAWRARACADRGLTERLDICAEFQGNGGNVTSLSWRSDGCLLLAATEDCRLRLWHGEQGYLDHTIDTVSGRRAAPLVCKCATTCACCPIRLIYVHGVYSGEDRVQTLHLSARGPAWRAEGRALLGWLRGGCPWKGRKGDVPFTLFARPTAPFSSSPPPPLPRATPPPSTAPSSWALAW